jgi:hypothetical protein
MAIAFKCLQCGKSYQAPDNLAGKTITCRACGAAMAVPGGASVSAPLPGAVPHAQPASLPSLGVPLLSVGAVEPQGGRRDRSLWIEGLVGLMLLITGGGLYWAYASLIRVTTARDRFEEVRRQMEARQPPPGFGGPGGPTWPGGPAWGPQDPGRAGSQPYDGRRPPYSQPPYMPPRPGPPYGPPPRQPAPGNR